MLLIVYCIVYIHNLNASSKRGENVQFLNQTKNDGGKAT